MELVKKQTLVFILVLLLVCVLAKKLIWIVKIVSAQTRFTLSGNSHSNILNCTHKGLDKIIDDLPLNIFS